MIEPIAKELVQLTGKCHNQPAEKKQQLKQTAARAISSALGEDTRSAFFKYSLAPRELVFDGVSEGRDDNPTEKFGMEIKPGKTVFDRIFDIHGSPIAIKYVAVEPNEEDIKPHPAWKNLSFTYTAFAAAAVRRFNVKEPEKPKLSGMIAVDSTNQGEFEKEDARILAVIGHLVAAGFQAAERKPCPSTDCPLKRKPRAS